MKTKPVSGPGRLAPPWLVPFVLLSWLHMLGLTFGLLELGIAARPFTLPTLFHLSAWLVYSLIYLAPALLVTRSVAWLLPRTPQAAVLMVRSIRIARLTFARRPLIAAVAGVWMLALVVQGVTYGVAELHKDGAIVDTARVYPFFKAVRFRTLAARFGVDAAPRHAISA